MSLPPSSHRGQPARPVRWPCWHRSWALAKAHPRALAWSVLAGSVAAAAPFLFATWMLALIMVVRDITVPSNWIGALGLALMPLLVSLPLVLMGMLCIVLPLSVLLRPWGWRGGGALVVLATLAGALLTALLVMVLPVHDAGWLVPLGALSGGVTALCWWAMLAGWIRSARYG